MRNSSFLFALFVVVALVSAFSVEDALNMNGIEEYLHRGVKRQGTGNSALPSATAEPSSDADPSETPEDTPTPTPTPTPEPEPSSAPADTPSSDEPSSAAPSEAPSQTPGPSSDAPASSDAQPTSAAASASASDNAPQSTADAPSRTSAEVTTPITRTSALVATSVREYTTVYSTIVNGQTQAVTSRGQSTALITTGVAISTEMPSVQSGSGESSGGISDSNKKVIGGVVGGIGGAILLGGIAIVCWRIWGRKKRVSEDDDDLMGGTGSALGDKPHSSSTNNTPFQQNLEQYHNPGGRPNAAANF